MNSRHSQAGIKDETIRKISDIEVKLLRAPWARTTPSFQIVFHPAKRLLLTDLARARHYDKRGGKARHITLDTALILVDAGQQEQPDLADLAEALKKLHETDARKSDVVELRFFGGLSVKECAEVLKVSQETVMRDWRLAKVWLLRELSQKTSNGR